MSRADIYTWPRVKQTPGGNWLYDTRSSAQCRDHLGGGMRWEVGGGLGRERTDVYLRLIHADVRQKPTQYCKAIIPQLKIN